MHDESTITRSPKRLSGQFLTGNELYAIACHSFDFFYERSTSGAGYQVWHNSNVIAEVDSAAQARITIVERFKELLKGGK
jgi:hypothetical protein